MMLTPRHLTAAEAEEVTARLQSPRGLTMAEMAAYGWDDDTWRAILAGVRATGLRMVLDRERDAVRFTDDEMERLRERAAALDAKEGRPRRSPGGAADGA
jgi:hypothetical protein